MKDITRVDLAIAANQQLKEEKYWLDIFSSEFNTLGFEPDKDSVQSNKRDSLKSFSIPGDVADSLMKLCNNSHYSLYYVLFTSLSILLHKYTNKNDVTCGSLIFGTNQKGENNRLNDIIPVRVLIEGELSFKDSLLRLKQLINEGNENYAYPMEILKEKLNLTNTQKGYQLFDVGMILENLGMQESSMPENFNFLFSFSEKDGLIKGDVHYNSDRYVENTIQRIICNYVYLLDYFINNLSKPINEVSAITSEERNLILNKFNSPIKDLPLELTIHKLFEKQVEKTPDCIALIIEDTAITYSELNKKANKFAHLLLERGIQKESIVAVMLKPSFEYIITVLGILKSGGAYLPISYDIPEIRLSEILNSSKCKFFITDDEVFSEINYTESIGLKLADVKLIRTSPRKQIKDFDSIIHPDRSLIDYNKYHKFIGIGMAKNTVSIQTTRGCPYNCAYCHKIWPKSHIKRTPENILEEIMYCYNAGVRKFVIVDDAFNLDIKNSSKVLETIIKKDLGIQLFFPNGLRCDILTKDYIDLLVEAGMVNLAFSLESASPRIQKLISKNLKLEKFEENLSYMIKKHPQVIVELFMILGFPSETVEEAQQTLDFLNRQKWIHFPNLFFLKIFPNTDIYNLAIENGISKEEIEKSSHLGYHELPLTLPFSQKKAFDFQSKFLTDYFLNRERLISVLPHQMSVLTESELTLKYNSYLPYKINSFNDLLKVLKIDLKDLNVKECRAEQSCDLNWKPKLNTSVNIPKKEKLKVLFLDLSQFFSEVTSELLYNVVEEPLGILYLMTTLKKTFGDQIQTKGYKSLVDFDSYSELKKLLDEFQPDIIGIRTLSYFKDFFHKTVSTIHNWNKSVPVFSGGPYATSEYEFLLKDTNVDLVILGEGEDTMVELIQAILMNENKIPEIKYLEKINGLVFNQNKFEKNIDQREIIVWEQIQDQLKCQSTDNTEIKLDTNNLLYSISTSGTTGTPKLVHLDHVNLLNLLNYQYSKTNIQFNTNVLQYASLNFDVSIQEIFSTLLAGGKLLLLDPNVKVKLKNLNSYVNKNQVETFFLPPALLKILFTDENDLFNFPSSTKHIVAAGEQLEVTTEMNKYLHDNKVFLHNHYGPSETHVVTTNTLDPEKELPALPTIGKPIQNTNIVILDSNQNIVPIGVIGEIYILGKSVGRTFLQENEIINPDLKKLTAETRIYRTGDYGKWLSNGEIKFLGRKDDQVKIRGFRIELQEIKIKLLEQEEVLDAIVTIYSDENKENRICAYIMSVKKDNDFNELKTNLAKSLPDYMIPSNIIEIDHIPLNRNGKLDINKLPKPLNTSNNIVLPGNNIEIKLLDLWSNVLKTEKEQISVETDFFELGGHSLKATILISKIEKEFSIELSLADFFNNKTIRSLAELIKYSVQISRNSVQNVEKREYYPLSSGQKRLYFLSKIDEKATSFNMPVVFDIKGKADIESYKTYFKTIIHRHEMLRTSFAFVKNDSYQFISEVSEIEVIDFSGMSSIENAFEKFVKPFDLSKPPLIHLGVMNRDENHYLFVDIHHIAYDGESLGNLMNEYINISNGIQNTEFQYQYKDYSSWQNNMLNSGKLKIQENFWLNHFKEDFPKIELPTDTKNEKYKTYFAANQRFIIEGEMLDKIKMLNKEKGTTIYMYLLAIFNILIHKIADYKDIVIASGVAGRASSEFSDLVGFFVNPLLMRNKINPQHSFEEFFSELKEVCINSYDNQLYPYDELIKNLTPSQRENAKYNIVVEYNDFVDENSREQNKNEQAVPTVKTHAKHDLIFFILDRGDSLSCRFEYKEDLFFKETIEKFVDYFLLIAESVLENKTIKITEIEEYQENPLNNIQLEEIGNELITEFDL